jgi:ADP-L-glycero-D-manno-heptose 6-epimerase
MIIVTGGTGFIGSNLVAALEEAGHHDIVVVDWLGQGDKWRNIAKRELRDIVNPENLFSYLDKHADEVEIIFHLGAISSTTETDVDLIKETNIVLSARLWDWCTTHEKRFIYASSAATYGDGSQGFKDEQHMHSLAKLRPLNAYGWSKNMVDRRNARLWYAHHNDKDVKVPSQWVGLKFFNVYGPNEYHKGEQMSVVCKLYPQIKAGEVAKLFKSHHPNYEDGGQLRDFIYVKDCVSVLLWLYRNKRVNGIYNVGTGQARSFKDLALSVFAAADKEPHIHYSDMPAQLRNKYQYFTEAPMDKLREEGYDKPFTSLEEGVKDYVQSYLSKDDPYR